MRQRRWIGILCSSTSNQEKRGFSASWEWDWFKNCAFPYNLAGTALHGRESLESRMWQDAERYWPSSRFMLNRNCWRNSFRALIWEFYKMHCTDAGAGFSLTGCCVLVRPWALLCGSWMPWECCKSASVLSGFRREGDAVTVSSFTRQLCCHLQQDGLKPPLLTFLWFR